MYNCFIKVENAILLWKKLCVARYKAPFLTRKGYKKSKIEHIYCVTKTDTKPKVTLMIFIAFMIIVFPLFICWRLFQLRPFFSQKVHFSLMYMLELGRNSAVLTNVTWRLVMYSRCAMKGSKRKKIVRVWGIYFWYKYT